jgi:WD40 repeat protein
MHKEPINYVDFNDEHKMSASASDDGTVHIHNHLSHRAEGSLTPTLTAQEKELPEVKICKFLKGTDCMVTADSNGFLNFYSLPTHPQKNQCLLRRVEYNEAEQLGAKTDIEYAIRGMDYDPVERMLYTGDEIGYI